MTAELHDPEYDPDAGTVGYLTWHQFDRLTRAVKDAQKHVSWWRVAGHIRSGDPDEHITRSNQPTIPLPATWLAADEISRLMVELNSWGTLEEAANTMDGQFFALLLIREVETAMHKWPISDRPHKVRYLRCRACQQVSLTYYPPKRGGADIEVKCTNKECRAVEDPAMFARDALLIRLEAERGSGHVGAGGRGTGTGEQVEANRVPVGS